MGDIEVRFGIGRSIRFREASMLTSHAQGVSTALKLDVSHV